MQMIHEIENVQIRLTCYAEIKHLIAEHVNSLIHPMDSWLEDNLLKSELYQLLVDSVEVGYIGVQKECLKYFYVKRPFFKRGPELLEKVIAALQLKSVFVMTQDQLLVTLISEWDYYTIKDACFFTDSRAGDAQGVIIDSRRFRLARLDEIDLIHQLSDDFFDDVSCGFENLSQRIEAETIFVLEEGKDIHGFGIMEKSLITDSHTSIGMFVNPAFRRRGAAVSLLAHLKERAYEMGLRPVSGCWYYNTLSRKSLESAGMIATAMGFEAVLKGKEKLPLRTGNPPGELVE